MCSEACYCSTWGDVGMAYKMFPSSMKSLDGVDVEARVSMQEQPVQSAIIEPRTNTVVEGDTIDVKVTYPTLLSLLSLLPTQLHRKLTLLAGGSLGSFPTEQRRALSALRLPHRTYTGATGHTPIPFVDEHGGLRVSLSVKETRSKATDGGAADAGHARAQGYAWSGGGRGIVLVDVSIDGGASWIPATLTEGADQKPNRAWAWTLWTAEVQVPRGMDKVRCRSSLSLSTRVSRALGRFPQA